MKREIIAKKEIKKVVLWEIGGMENAITDKVDDFETYVELLKNRDELIKYLYDEALCEIPTHVRFLGREKIVEIIEKIVQKEGYWDLSRAIALLFYCDEVNKISWRAKQKKKSVNINNSIKDYIYRIVSI